MQMQKEKDVVPYVVKQLHKDYSKALFAVPPHLVNQLVKHPICCHGSMFYLQRDTSNNYFIRAEYYSVNAEATAVTLARRLEKRIHECSLEHRQVLAPSSSVSSESPEDVLLQGKLQYPNRTMDSPRPTTPMNYEQGDQDDDHDSYDQQSATEHHYNTSPYYSKFHTVDQDEYILHMARNTSFLHKPHDQQRRHQHLKLETKVVEEAVPDETHRLLRKAHHAALLRKANAPATTLVSH